MHKILLAVAALGFHLPAQATQISADDASRAAILTLTLEQVFDKPVEGGPSTVRPIVAAPDVTLPANLTAFGQPLKAVNLFHQKMGAMLATGKPGS